MGNGVAMSPRENVISIDSHKSMGGGHRELLEACKRQADEHLRVTVQRVFDNVDDTLFEMASKGAGAANETLFFEAMRDIRLHRKDMARRFQDSFDAGFRARLRKRWSPAGGGQQPALDDRDALSLVDNKDLEEELAIDGLVSKANDRFKEPLEMLSQRLDVLIEAVKIEPGHNPVGPDVLCHAFRSAFADMELRVEVKLIIYKLFDQYVMRTLGALYDALNQHLINAGILPHLKPERAHRIVPQTSAQRPRLLPQENPAGPRGSYGPAADDTAYVPSAEAAGDVYDLLQQLMSARKGVPAGAFAPVVDGGGYAGPAGAVSAVPLSATDLLDALSHLQHRPQDEGRGFDDSDSLKGALLAQLGPAQHGGARPAIAPSHDNTIDVVWMIFEFILDEPSIPDAIKAVISQLQIPILKVALLDHDFFSKRQHPARRLLNVLGHAGIGWQDLSEDTQARRFGKIDHIVKRALAEFEDQPDIFSVLLDEFTAFMATEGEDLVEPDVAEESPEQDRAQLAFEAIEAHLESDRAPQSLRHFFRDTWRLVLEQTLADEGEDSKAWREREHAIDELLWSAEPKDNPEDRQRLVALLPRLLETLRCGMQSVGYDEDTIEAQIESLESIHIASLRGGHSVDGGAALKPETDVSAMIRAIQDGMGELDDDLLDGMADMDGLVDIEMSDMEQGLPEVNGASEKPLVEDEFSQQARELAIGTWLEFELDGKKKRAKLAWKSAVLGQYVFVDRKFKVVVEKTLPELADDLRHSRAMPVDNVAMFDRALDAVLNGLMSGPH
ncbi:MAG TPA: DUF1631 domain-containing protein [Gammaproteobacteria bacterium]|nr:DUF1631 domain-containing protein [Gammaproteobacteria bacterium]